jgi:hypothetical protein
MANIHATDGGKTKLMSYCRITITVIVLFSLGLSMVGTASVAASPISNSSQLGGGQELQEEGQDQQRILQVCGSISNMTESTTNDTTATTTATGIDGANNNATTSLYENPDYGVQILCPENWVYLEEVNPVTGDLQVYFTPLAEVEQPQTTGDETPPTVSVATMQLPTANLGVPLFADLNIEDLTSSGYEIISSSLNATLSGMPAWEVVYVDTNRTMFLQDWTIQGDRAYAVFYVSHESRFNEFLPIAQDMISSFTIITNDTSNTTATMGELPPQMNTTTTTTATDAAPTAVDSNATALSGQGE